MNGRPAGPSGPASAAGPSGRADEIRVLIADDEALVRAGFRMLVDSAADLRVVGEACDGIQAPPEHLLDAIRIVARGDALLTPSITRRLIAEFARRPRTAPAADGALAHLTEREYEVLEQVAAGLSNAEIAANLHLSVATIKTHVSRLLSKLHGRDRAQLVVIAYETGVAAPRRLT